MQAVQPAQLECSDENHSGRFAARDVSSCSRCEGALLALAKVKAELARERDTSQQLTAAMHAQRSALSTCVADVATRARTRVLLSSAVTRCADLSSIERPGALGSF